MALLTMTTSFSSDTLIGHCDCCKIPITDADTSPVIDEITDEMLCSECYSERLGVRKMKRRRRKVA